MKVQLSRTSLWQVFVVVCLILPAGAARSDDHGNTAATSTLVEVGQIVSGSHETAGDTDFFRFLLAPDRLYRIETFNLVPAGQSDTVIVLYQFDGQQLNILAEDDQGGSETNASKILWPNTLSGVYYLEVFQFLSSATGEYQFIVEDTGAVPEDDHGDTPAEATVLTVDGPAVAGDIELAADQDYFSFSVIQGLFYDLQTLNPGPETDTVLTLFAPNGQTRLAEDDQSGIDYNASRIIFLATSSSTLFARVTHFLSTGTGNYEIRVSLEGAAIDLIPGASPVAGVLEGAGDVDIFSLSAAKNHIYEFELITDNLINRFEMNILAPDGRTVIHYDDFGAGTILWTAPEQQKYFFIIREDVQGGAFDLSLSDLGALPPDADLNHDGVVDASDLLLLMNRWKEVIPTPTP